MITANEINAGIEAVPVVANLITTLVHSIEALFGNKHKGANKKAAVQAAVTSALSLYAVGNQAAAAVGHTLPAKLNDAISLSIDSTVALSNALGVFHHATPAIAEGVAA